MQLWNYTEAVLKGVQSIPQGEAPMGEITAEERIPLPGPPSPPWPGSSQVLSPPDCLPVVLSFAHRTSGIFHYHVSTESLPG